MLPPPDIGGQVFPPHDYDPVDNNPSANRIPRIFRTHDGDNIRTAESLHSRTRQSPALAGWVRDKIRPLGEVDEWFKSHAWKACLRGNP